MTDLPDKLYYSIREVSEHTGVEPHVLRYWESEFPTLRPKRARSGTRTYRRRDIDEILAIKKLLQDEGYRIAGARKLLGQKRREAARVADVSEQISLDFAAMDAKDRMSHVRGELRQILDLVKGLRGKGGS